MEQSGAEVIVFVVQEKLLVKEPALKGTHPEQHGGTAYKTDAGRAFGYGRTNTVPQQVRPAVIHVGLTARLK